jgi:hypothetical protein
VRFDIFSPSPGDSEVMSQVDRLSSIEKKMAASVVWTGAWAMVSQSSVLMLHSSDHGGAGTAVDASHRPAVIAGRDGIVCA